MSASCQKNEELYQALFAGDLPRAGELLRSGGDINACDEDGESFLTRLITLFEDAERPAMIRFMLEHGANPALICSDGYGPLFAAVIAKDTETLRLLLDHGADPNHEHDASESLYEWAEFDYRFDYFDLTKFPQNPTEADELSEDAWLRFLDRIAAKAGVRRPDYLLLLRERGALTAGEQKQKAAGGSALP